jgi:hypothetical protein
MDISSWIQKGSPDRCPACRKILRPKPDLLSGEAPCPYCGRLLWFFVIKGETYFLFPEDVDSLDKVELMIDLEEENFG